MSRLIQASANNSLDVLLEELCSELGLTRTQHESASRAYQTVGDWVANDTGTLSVFRPRVFPQGSIPQGTAVRPRETDQFDADAVCLLQAGHGLTADAAYELLHARVAEHGTYRHRLRREPRCIRIDYEGSLHLDVIPAIPAPTGILIPTADRRGWQPSDPEGYEAWLDAVVAPTTLTMDKRADAEPMPPFAEAGERPPLKRIVQLAKRRREVVFGNSVLKPKSILLTTLGAQNWGREPLASDGLLGMLTRLKGRYPLGSAPSPVLNPVNGAENLARHWVSDPGAYEQFTRFVSDFEARMSLVLQAKGMEAVSAALEELFDPKGSGIIKTAVARSTDRFQRDRERNLILAAGSSAQAAGRIIPRNQFYGR